MRGPTRMLSLYRGIGEDQKRASQAPHLLFSLKLVTLGLAPLLLIFPSDQRESSGASPALQ
jgi:hypothetical protein